MYLIIIFFVGLTPTKSPAHRPKYKKSLHQLFKPPNNIDKKNKFYQLKMTKQQKPKQVVYSYYATSRYINLKAIYGVDQKKRGKNRIGKSTVKYRENTKIKKKNLQVEDSY